MMPEMNPLIEARVYLRNLVASSPKLAPEGAEVINTEQSLRDPGRLFFDLDDGTRMEVTVSRYPR